MHIAINNEKQSNTTPLELFQESNIKIAETGNIDTLNTYTFNHSLSWLSTDISIKSGGVEQVL